MEDNKFAKGLFVKLPNDKAPKFVLLDMSFKPHEFFTWCQDHVDQKGWVNLQILRSKDGSKLYGKLNDWKPTKVVDSDTGEELPSELQPRTLTPEQKATMTVDEVADMSSIPF